MSDWRDEHTTQTPGASPKGFPPPWSAARLVISESTVKNHVSNILSRLGLRDRTQAALYARDHGLA